MGYHPAGAGHGACYVHLDGQNRPLVLVGAITIHDTDDRDNPPPPICGLNIDYTPLGRGHIMALQLGGPDVSENIVPQYQQWQQTGAWRVMERAAMAHASVGNFVFAAAMTYGNTGDAVAGDYWAEFQDNPTFFWDDHRVPTHFKVWVLGATTAHGAQLTTQILAPTAAATRATAAGLLAVTLSTTAPFAEFTVIGRMPAEDLAFWRTTEVGNTVTVAFESYTTAHRQGTANPDYMMSPRRTTEAEFVQEYGEQVREVLAGRGWHDHELNQHASNTHMLEAVYHERPLKSRSAKNIELRMQKHLKVKNDWTKVPGKPKDMKRRTDASAMLRRAIQGTNLTHS